MLLQIAEYISAISIIVGAVTMAVSKVFDTKLKPLNNRDRMQLRYQIVAFASDLHQNIPHTRDEYLAIFELITEYNAICKSLEIENHVFEEEKEYIHKCYQSLDILNKVE